MKLKKKHKNDSKKSDLKVESCCKLQLFDTPGSAPPVSLSKELGSKEGTRLRQQTIHFNAISQLSQILSDSFSMRNVSGCLEMLERCLEEGLPAGK